MAKKTPLPKRFQPLQSQAQTETAIRYGSQEDALRSIFNQATTDYSRAVDAQTTATAGLLGALDAAPGQITQAFTDAGLTPSLLAQIANSPTGQRLAGELARAQTGVVQQRAGANAGAAYQLGHLSDQYREDVGKINDQASSLAKEKGLYESSLLDQLIGTDRKTRHDQNVHVADQQFTADQNALDNATSTGNALIGQGIDPTTGAPIPGAKSNRPKPKPKATPHEQSAAESDFTAALGNAQAMSKSGVNAADIVKALSKGRKAAPGKPVYEDVPVTDSYGNVVKGKTKRQPKLDPETGTVVTTGGKESVDPVEPAIAQAAAEMATTGYVSPATVKHLHDLGYKVRGLPNIKTTFDRPKPSPYTLPNHQGTAPTRNQQPG